jgi:hypothetical protein
LIELQTRSIKTVEMRQPGGNLAQDERDGRGKKQSPEVVNLLRQIEMAVANGKMTPQSNLILCGRLAIGSAAAANERPRANSAPD